MSSNNNSTCSKCGRVYSPAGQGDCTFCPANHPFWNETSDSSLNWLSSTRNPQSAESVEQGNKFLAKRVTEVTEEIQRAIKGKGDESVSANFQDLTGKNTFDIELMIMEKEKAETKIIEEILGRAWSGLEGNVEIGSLTKAQGRLLQEALREVWERVTKQSRERLEEEKKGLLERLESLERGV
ncbi:hypothetical protein BJY04DRAFT_213997 [Aspergillus karnatakaensis]|uniref:uncharacterized protein n=1 Tax=Aspergillus karnatakaensis TaxID=1810916 RepID=UPI003CCDDCA5